MMVRWYLVMDVSDRSIFIFHSLPDDLMFSRLKSQDQKMHSKAKPPYLKCVATLPCDLLLSLYMFQIIGIFDISVSQGSVATVRE